MEMSFIIDSFKRLGYRYEKLDENFIHSFIKGDIEIKIVEPSERVYEFKNNKNISCCDFEDYRKKFNIMVRALKLNNLKKNIADGIHN